MLRVARVAWTAQSLPQAEMKCNLPASPYSRENDKVEKESTYEQRARAGFTSCPFFISAEKGLQMRTFLGMGRGWIASGLSQQEKSRLCCSSEPSGCTLPAVSPAQRAV